MGKSRPSAPPKPKMSELERTQHAVAAAEWDHNKQTYHPMRGEYLRDAGRDRGDRARAQASSAVMKEGTEAMQLAALGGGVSRVGGGVGAALGEARVGATAAERAERDGRKAGALGVGREIQTDTSRSLSALGRSGAQGAIGEMQNRLTVDNARSAARAQMVGSVVGAGAAVGMHHRDKRNNAAPPTVEDRGASLANTWARDTPASGAQNWR